MIKVTTEYGHPVFLNYSNNAPSMIGENKIIKSISLDELVKTKKIYPKFIKIDVEGAEFSVLQGMRNILENFTPTIMIEKHPTLLPKNLKISNIDNFLVESGYKVEKENL